MMVVDCCLHEYYVITLVQTTIFIHYMWDTSNKMYITIVISVQLHNICVGSNPRPLCGYKNEHLFTFM